MYGAISDEDFSIIINLIILRKGYSMPDPEIIAFFTKYPDSKESPRFSRRHWLSDAAKRAKQLSLTTHPLAFSHPGARKHRHKKVSTVLTDTGVKKKMMASCDQVIRKFHRMQKAMRRHWKYTRF